MKAMILAAGLGSRLGQLTRHIPKPLLPVDGVKLMFYTLDNLRGANVSSAIANVYYLSEKMYEFREYYEDKYNALPTLYCKEEKALSGTAGALRACKDFFEDEEYFIVTSGDILTNFDFKRLIDYPTDTLATIVLKRVDISEVSKYGVVVTDDEGHIIEFQEKPPVELAKSTLINTGIYLFHRNIFNYIPENKFCDFAKDVFPKLVEEGQLSSITMNDYWNDIGSVESYAQAQVDATLNLF